MRHALVAFLSILSLVACSGPQVEPVGVPEPDPLFGLPMSVAPAPTDAPDRPKALTFEAKAGNVIALRASSDSGQPLLVCVMTADAYSRYSTGQGEPEPTDIAANGYGCEVGEAGVAELGEVLPRSGRYVLLASNLDGAAPPPFRLEPLNGVSPLPLLSPGVSTQDTLGLPRPWSPSDTDEVGIHFVRGSAGERLTVTLESEAFEPYVEVGTWSHGGYTSIVGQPGSEGTATVSFDLPADGVYTLLTHGGGGTGAYRIRATSEASRPWAERLPGGGAPSDRYALIVAVADYPGAGYSQDDDLTGPTADGQSVRELLVGTYGYKPENVLVLQDADATREAMLAGFTHHLGQAGPEGTAFFYYSGHGTQVPVEALPSGVTPVREEADGLEESLVLWDTGARVTVLLDHELGALAEGLQAGHTALVLDNCNSGDGTRGGEGRGATDTPTTLGAVVERSVGRPGHRLESLASTGAPSSGRNDPGSIRGVSFEHLSNRFRSPAASVAPSPNVGAERHVLLAASRANQVSLEMGGLAPDGGSAGVFTSILIPALREASPDDTWSQILARVRPRVRQITRDAMDSYGYQPQDPQVEGAQASDTVGDVLGTRR